MSYLSGALFAGIHAIPGVLSYVFYFGPLAWALASLLGSLALIYASVASAPASRLLYGVCVVSALVFLLNLLLAISFFTQASGFNDQFFAHLTIDSAVIAWNEQRPAVVALVFGQVLALLAPLGVAKAYAARRSLGAGWVSLLLLGGLFFCYPAWSILSFLTADVDVAAYEAHASAAVQAPDTQAESPSRATKNIILIYAEQLEQLYLDTAIFPENPLHELNELYSASLRFTNLRQLPGTSWTTAGIIASQCGFGVEGGIHYGGNTRLSAVEKPYPEAECFADVLQKNGYRSVFLGGAPHAYGGKGYFLKAHGYDAVFGWDELVPRLPDPEYSSAWGVHDDDLLTIAMQEVRNLEREEAPYLLSLLTLGTHHPRGYLSKSCERRVVSDDPMVQALDCSSQLLSGFLKDLQSVVSSEDTVVAVVSDHLVLRNTVSDRLIENQEARRLLFFLASEASEEISEPMSHFDIGPTLLEAAGFSPATTIGYGRSFFSEASRGDRGHQAADVEVPPLIAANLRESGIAVDLSTGKALIGDTEFLISADGGEFALGFFMMVFDEEGRLYDTIYTTDPTPIARDLDNRITVTIAKQGKSLPSALYVGRLSASDTFNGTAFEVRERITLSPADIETLLASSRFPRSRPDIPDTRTRLIAHSGGALGELTYTNSLDALEANKNAFDLFEVDLNFTSDGHLACIHDWDVTFEKLFGPDPDGAVSLAAFKSMSSDLSFRPCDLDSLAAWLAENPSKKVITDIKDDNLAALKLIASRFPELIDRFVPQSYRLGDFADIADLGYQNVILTLYALREIQVSDLVDDLSKHQYFAVAFPESVAGELAGILAPLGLRMYVHTINSHDRQRELQQQGVWGIYTDFLRYE